MIKKLCAIVFMFLLAGFYSCGTANTAAKDNTDLNTENNFDWDGVYTGTIPGADSSINVEITLKKDGAYTVLYQYEKTNDIAAYTGTFNWKDNNTVQLDNTEIPPYYLVEKGALIQLDMAGEKMSGENANMYVLKKEP